MNFVYGIALVIGFVALVVWVIGTFLPNGLNERMVARRTVGGLIAFGMGGLSASYAGWPQLGALGAGVVAAVVVAWYVGRA
jgi:hypothetical protein